MTHFPAETKAAEPTTRDCSTRARSASRPSVVRAAIAVTVALTLSVLATAFVATSTDDRYAGTLMTGSVLITSPATGEFETLDVASGEIVLPERELFLVTDEERDQRILEARNRVGRIQSQLAAAQATARVRSEEQLASINSEVFDTEMHLADFLRLHFQHKFEVTAWTDYLDPGDALASSETPPIDLESAILRRHPDSGEARIRAIISRATSENEVESLEAKISLCESRLSSLQKQRDKIVEANRVSLGIATILDQLSVAQVELAELESSPAEHIVVSPAFGMTGLIRRETGDHVNKGDVLLELFDRDDEFVRIEFPSRVAAQLRKGTRVTLEFPGDEQRLGEIDDVPPQVTSPADGEQTDSRIAVRVVPCGRAWPTVPVGSTVHASFE